MPKYPDDQPIDRSNLPTLEQEGLDSAELQLIEAWADQSPEFQRHIEKHGIESLGMLARSRLATIHDMILTVKSRNPTMHRIQIEEMFTADKYGLPVIQGPDGF